MRKLYLLIIAVCCVQLCYGDLDDLTDEDINRFRNPILTVPGVKKETIDTLQGILNKLKTGTSSDEKTEGTLELITYGIAGSIEKSKA
ncbi:hypothetical protein Bhyg_03597 [Pseudolycoriella hygida]|uniref:Uncharacterized protein n=1 Tax=Pseudolycoriella hygida TaxID=35572 RepID=A0A9Q0S7N2_9DIPT|nr:hypothetical protein Bhyg_03597 [Pseudolycoriella hygida]